jgi:hypothetical protein
MKNIESCFSDREPALRISETLRAASEFLLEREQPSKPAELLLSN